MVYIIDKSVRIISYYISFFIKDMAVGIVAYEFPIPIFNVSVTVRYGFCNATGTELDAGCD